MGITCRGWLALGAVRVDFDLSVVSFLSTSLSRLGFDVSRIETAPWSPEEQEGRHRCGSMRLGRDSIIAMLWRLRKHPGMCPWYRRVPFWSQLPIWSPTGRRVGKVRS